MKNIAAAFSHLKKEIRLLEKRYGRQPNSVTLLAVSKKKPAFLIKQALGAGQTEFGENYLQEALHKIQEIDNDHACWHFIGSIQSNKTRTLAEHFTWVHTVDRIKIAYRLNEQRPKQLAPLNICIQINISGEDSKNGIPLTQTTELANQITQLPRLKLRGLMTLPKPSKNISFQRKQFQAVRECFEDLRGNGLPLDTLSMGTSEDMEAAIAEGSTLVRVGTLLFGPRE